MYILYIYYMCRTTCIIQVYILYMYYMSRNTGVIHVTGGWWVVERNQLYVHQSMMVSGGWKVVERSQLYIHQGMMVSGGWRVVERSQLYVHQSMMVSGGWRVVERSQLYVHLGMMVSGRWIFSTWLLFNNLFYIPGVGTPILEHGRDVPRWWPPFLKLSIRLGPYFIPHHNPIDFLFLQKTLVCLYPI